MPDSTAFNAENNLTVNGSTAEILIDARIDGSPWAWELGWINLKSFQSVVRAAGGGIRTWVFRFLSPGGNAVVGNAIANEIKRLGVNAETIAEIEAVGSAATVMALNCQTVRIASNGHFFIHQAQGGREGTAEQIESYAKLVKNADDSMVAIYTERSKQPEADVREWMRVETWFNAAEAVALGFCDALSDAVDELEAFTPDGLTDFENVVTAFGSLRSQVRRGPTPDSDQSDDADAEDEEELMSDPKPATLAELKAACPDADSDFILGQLEANATETVAIKAWATKLTADNAALKADAEKATKERDDAAQKLTALEAKDKSKSRGNGIPEANGDVDADGDDAGDDGEYPDPIASWNKAVAEKRKAGVKAEDIPVQVTAENPGLHQAYLDAWGAKYGTLDDQRKRR